MILRKIKNFIQIGRQNPIYFLEKLKDIKPNFDTIQIEHNLKYFETNKINSQFYLSQKQTPNIREQISLGLSEMTILTEVNTQQTLIPRIALPPQVKSFHNHFMHQCYQQIIHKLTSELKQINFVKVEDTSQETRGLEWCRVSFMMLKNALKKASEETESLIQAKVFYTDSTKTGKPLLHLGILSLEIVVSIEDYGLFVEVFDNKNNGFGYAKEPSFSGQLVATALPFTDELIFLLSDLGKALEWK
jgi:hypothetical protein